jgi:hypothetical protein
LTAATVSRSRSSSACSRSISLCCQKKKESRKKYSLTLPLKFRLQPLCSISFFAVTEKKKESRKKGSRKKEFRAHAQTLPAAAQSIFLHRKKIYKNKIYALQQCLQPRVRLQALLERLYSSLYFFLFLSSLWQHKEVEIEG